MLSVVETLVPQILDSMPFSPDVDDLATILPHLRTMLFRTLDPRPVNPILAKGRVVGKLNFIEGGDLIDCNCMGVGGKAIPPDSDLVEDVSSSALFILLVDKEVAFIKLAELNFFNMFSCIIILSSGPPDFATRSFLAKLRQELRLPVCVFALVDSDAYSLKNLLAYQSPEQFRLPMTQLDIIYAQNLLRDDDFVNNSPGWAAELELMLDQKQKVDIQALSFSGFEYLSQVYLPLKLLQKDWISMELKGHSPKHTPTTPSPPVRPPKRLKSSSKLLIDVTQPSSAPTDLINPLETLMVSCIQPTLETLCITLLGNFITHYLNKDDFSSLSDCCKRQYQCSQHYITGLFFLLRSPSMLPSPPSTTSASASFMPTFSRAQAASWGTVRL